MYCDIIINMAPKAEASGVINLKALFHLLCARYYYVAVSRWCA